MREYKYTDRQITTLLDLYFRDHPRPAPWYIMVSAIDDENISSYAIDRIIWGAVTGYPGREATGERRAAPQWPLGHALCRAGRKWHQREDNALRAALGGEGQRRNPPCCTTYIATVLARPVLEVQERWATINGDTLGRTDFGLGQQLCQTAPK